MSSEMVLMSLDRTEQDQSHHLERFRGRHMGKADMQTAGFTSLYSRVGRRALPWGELSAAQPRASEGSQPLPVQL